MQYAVLRLFQRSQDCFLGLSAHTFHVLQPLDVNVNGTFKSIVQRQIHIQVRDAQVLDASDVSKILNICLSEALTANNVISGFKKTGV